MLRGATAPTSCMAPGGTRDQIWRGDVPHASFHCFLEPSGVLTLCAFSSPALVSDQQRPLPGETLAGKFCIGGCACALCTRATYQTLLCSARKRNNQKPRTMTHRDEFASSWLCVALLRFQLHSLGFWQSCFDLGVSWLPSRRLCRDGSGCRHRHLSSRSTRTPAAGGGPECWGLGGKSLRSSSYDTGHLNFKYQEW